MDSRNLYSYSDAPEKEEAGPPPGAAAPDFSLPAGRESLTDHGTRQKPNTTTGALRKDLHN